MKTLIRTVPGMGRSIVDHDPRNRNYPVRGVLFKESSPLRERVWRGHYAWDQGQKPWCVAYSGKGMLNRFPFSKTVDYNIRYKHSFEEFYRGAQENDEWEGSNYDGTSGRGLLRYLSSLGVIREYRWCFGIDDVLQTLSDWGPVSVGTWWAAGMSHPDPAKRYVVNRTGEYIGGHQYTAIGVDPENEEVEFMNSWGKTFGDRGRFRMKFSTLDSLLRDQGDAYTLVTV